MNPKTLPLAGDKAVQRCIRYLRVSTKEQMDTDADAVEDGNSIDTQRKACQAKEKRLGLVCVGEYVEPASAKNIKDRKEFKKVLKRFREEHDAEYLSIYMRSRAFRDYIEAGQTERELLETYGVKMVSAREDFGDDLNGQLMKAVTDVLNWYEARRNGEDIKVKMANKVANGGTLSRAKLGYLNVTLIQEGRHINTVIVDEERKPFIIMAFELFATGSYTLERLLQELTRAGLRTRPTVRFPNGKPMTLEMLRKTLRSRYYIGWITFKGVEYQGRHETFISPELFDRVQRVLDSHQGSGVRERKHPHYLKGWLWCNRCGKRFTVQRAVGRHGGEYYYFFCMGRQDGSCNHPFVPVEQMEEAITRHYRATVTLPADFRAEIRAMVDEAASTAGELTVDSRQQFEKRLSELARKEDYLLDLASEEGWPKEMLREKIGAIRHERGDIERSLSSAKQQVDAGCEVFYKGLHLLDDPAGMYERGNETVRTILNRAIFARFYIDGKKVVRDAKKEPFGALDEVYRRRQARRYYRAAGWPSTHATGLLVAPDLAELEARWHDPRGGVALSAGTAARQRPTLDTEDGATVELSLTDQLDLALTLRARGSSKTVMVGEEGIEPSRA